MTELGHSAELFEFNAKCLYAECLMFTYTLCLYAECLYDKYIFGEYG
jgi:hypothetical protein